MSPSRLSALDAAFLSLESEHAPMHVGWAALFAPRGDGSHPSFEDVREHVAGRLGRAPRYRQRLAGVPFGLGDPVWVDDGAFDIARHVRRAPHADFPRLADEVLSAPLEHGRPLWELWICEQTADGYVGVVGKAHHCLVDGLAAVELMALLLDTTPSPETVADESWVPRALPGAVKLARDAVGFQVQQAAGLAKLPLQWARDPAQALDLGWRAARHLARSAAPIAPPSAMNGAMSSMRHLACHSRPMEDLKIIKRRFGTTVNDILLTVSAGALRGLGGQRVKAMVPVSVQAPGEQWGNRIAFLFLELPCEEDDPVWRLRDIHVAMRDRKRDGEPEGADAVLNAVAYAPRTVRRLASKVIASPQLSNLTISNIPGPQMAVYLMGCEVKQAYPVVPLTAGHGLSIGMTTIHERACFGVYAQAELAGEADRIARGIGHELEQLLARAAA